jgi:hypothetical protein
MTIFPLGTRPWVKSVRGSGEKARREASPTGWDWSVCGRLPNEKKDRRCYAEVMLLCGETQGFGVLNEAAGEAW